jgi:hypothetical protein
MRGWSMLRSFVSRQPNNGWVLFFYDAFLEDVSLQKASGAGKTSA